MSQAQYESAARAAARRNGIDEEMFIRLVASESGWDPSAGSGAGAIGLTQLMPATAAGLGVDPYDPIQNLEGGAKYLRQMLDRYDGDKQKALAAYVSGPGTVDKALDTKRIFGPSFLGGQSGSLADMVQKDADPNKWYDRWLSSLGDDAAGASAYVSKILTGLSDPTMSTGTSSSGSSTRTPGARGFIKPTLEDFKIYAQDPLTGEEKWTGEYDVVNYNRAMAEYLESEAPTDDFAKFLDAVINAASTEIELGNSNVTKAKLEFDRQMKAHEVGANQFNELLGYSLPAGTQYKPFREPGGLVERQLGMPATHAPNVPFDPFAEAWKVVQNTPDLTTINTAPTGDLMSRYMSQARNLSSSPTTPAAPTTPNPPPVGVASSQNAEQLAQEFARVQGNLAAQYDGV